MKFIKNCPLFLLILSTGILFSIVALGGKNTIYAAQEYEPLKAPVLSIMFTAINDNIYPWQLLNGDSVEAGSPLQESDLSASSKEQEADQEQTQKQDQIPEQEGSEPSKDQELAAASASPEREEEENGEADPSVEGGEEGALASPSPEADINDPSQETEGEDAPFERLEPLRESTYDEYINHISADIYGDAGVIRAAGYEFEQVDESYFDDALFIGDSRTVGLRDYTDLSEHADFYCETSLTIYKAMEENFKGKGTVREALESKDYGKIYIMVGINELGRGTTEDFMSKYTEVIDILRELEPEAKIFIQAIMRVSGKKDSEDAIFNNSNINARNNAIATLADNKQIFYIDVNEAVCDEEGNLNQEYTFDQIHLLGVHNELWKQFLLAHGA